MKSINEMDAEFRDTFNEKRLEIMRAAELVESAGLRDKAEGIYAYYEGADYIGIETYTMEALTVVRDKLEPTMGPCAVTHVFELTDGKMNAFYKFNEHPVFSLRLAMNPDEFPIDEVLPGSKIVKIDGSRYEVVKAI
jgi:hypothetical protein